MSESEIKEIKDDCDSQVRRPKADAKAVERMGRETKENEGDCEIV